LHADYGYTRANTLSLPCTTNHARTHTHTHKCAILTTFPRQKWFRERSSILHYTYIACFVTWTFSFLCTHFYRLTERTRSLLASFPPLKGISQLMTSPWCLYARANRHFWSWWPDF
jgi:hypothetical protein